MALCSLALGYVDGRHPIRIGLVMVAARPLFGATMWVAEGMKPDPFMLLVPVIWLALSVPCVLTASIGAIGRNHFSRG